MRHKAKTINWRPLIVALIVSAAMLAVGAWAIEGVTAAHIGRRIAWPLARLLLVIAVGLAVGQLIEAAGWTRKLGVLGAPLFRFARLGSHCSAAFTTAFFSGEAANAMLLGFWKDGRIDRTQLVLTHLANQVPAFFLHLPTTVFMVLPLTGWAGGLYFIITFLAALLRLLAVLLVGRWCLAPVAAQVTFGDGAKPAERGAALLWATLKQKLPPRLMNVATYVVPIYIAVFLLNSAGLFEWTQAWLARGFSSAFIPLEALSLVVLSFTAEFASGFAAAGALMHEGVISTKQAVLALLIGNIVAFPVRALRHQLPRLLGIFAPRMGMMLLLLGQGTRVVSLIVVGAVYWVLF
jgi:hypothetical protein